MPREAIVNLPCRVKHELGEGDLRGGSRLLVNLLRAQERVAAVRARPRQDGKPIESVPLSLPLLTDSGVENVTRTVGELESELVVLDPLVPYCTNCPANALRRPFGCVGGLPFPISRAVEKYALERVALPDRLGGALLLQSLFDAGIDGSRSREYRAEAKFESMSAASRKLGDNAFGKATLSADELFEPLLLENGQFVPWMALNALLWFEAVSLDEKLPETINDALTLTRLEPAARLERTKCVLGPPASDPNAEPFRGLLKFLHVGWSRDIPVQLDS